MCRARGARREGRSSRTWRWRREACAEWRGELRRRANSTTPARYGRGSPADWPVPSWWHGQDNLAHKKQRRRRTAWTPQAQSRPSSCNRDGRARHPGSISPRRRSGCRCLEHARPKCAAPPVRQGRRAAGNAGSKNGWGWDCRHWNRPTARWPTARRWTEWRWKDWWSPWRPSSSSAPREGHSPGSRSPSSPGRWERRSSTTLRGGPCRSRNTCHGRCGCRQLWRTSMRRWRECNGWAIRNSHYAWCARPNRRPCRCGACNAWPGWRRRWSGQPASWWGCRQRSTSNWGSWASDNREDECARSRWPAGGLRTSGRGRFGADRVRVRSWFDLAIRCE